MATWFVFALMTAGAIFAVLWPLGRRPAAGRAGSETAIYLDQLGEIDRDLGAGTLRTEEADAARIEVSRRLLASAEAEQTATASIHTGLRRAVAIAAIVALPLASISLYLRYGSPALPDAPLAERSRAPDASASLDALVSQVEAHLEKNPKDGRGWDVLAPALMRLNRFDDAARAWRNALSFSGDSAARRAYLGETLVAAANGVVTADARLEFERALALDAGEIKARYFVGLAAQQDGQTGQAAAIWRDMLKTAPPDAPWRPTVEQALAMASADSAPALADDDIAAAKDMSAEDRSRMVRGMVDRLAARLKQNSDDAQGWLRLVRAYMVLGERDKARAALVEARQAMTGNPDGLRQIDNGLKDTGLDG